jgi:hypothetical protein
MRLDRERLMERIRLALADLPASIDANYELAFDEAASPAARQYAIRNLLRRGSARSESTQPDPEFVAEPMSEKTRAVLEAIFDRLK